MGSHVEFVIAEDLERVPRIHSYTFLPLNLKSSLYNVLFNRPAIRHDILDFCVRELGALGGANIYVSFLHPRRNPPSLLTGRRRVNAAGSYICEGQDFTIATHGGGAGGQPLRT